MKRKTPPDNLPDIDVLKDRIVQLRARDRQLCADQVEIESHSAHPLGSDLSAQAERLAFGDQVMAPDLAQNLQSQRDQIRLEREAIAKAIHKLQMKISEACHRRAVAEIERRSGDYREMLRSRAILICQLQRANREIDDFQKEITRGVLVNLPGQFPAPKIGGYGISPSIAPGFGEFISLMVKLQIITQSEIDQIRGHKKER